MTDEQPPAGDPEPHPKHLAYPHIDGSVPDCEGCKQVPRQEDLQR